METIVKVLKAFFLGADGEVDATTLQKFKRCLLWVVLGAGLTIGALIWWADSEDETPVEDETEYVYYDADGNEISEQEYYELGGE